MNKQVHILLYYLDVPLTAIGYWLFALQPAIGIVLGFIGTKMIFDFFGKQLEPSTSSYFLTLIFIIH